MKSGIYKIINLVNKKIYIGSAVDLEKRFYGHLNSLRKQKHVNKHLQFSFNKYGEECFKFEIIEYCEREKLIEREQYYIDKYKACEKGYNICLFGRSRLGIKLSERHKKRISLSGAGKHHHPCSEEAKRKLSIARKGCISNWKGKHHSENSKKKIGDCARGRILSKETKQKLSIALKAFYQQKKDLNTTMN